MKQGPHAGFCPADATMLAAAEDFGLCFDQLLRTDAGGVFAKVFAKPMADYTLAIRKLTGIRPMGLRWDVWLGHRVLAASAPEGLGVCTRPGLLLRAIRYYQTLRSVTETDPIHQMGPVFYAWRDNYFIFSGSRDYVAACLTGPAPALEPSRSSPGFDEIRFQPMANPEFDVRVKAKDGLPVSGWIYGALQAADQPLTLPDAWPGNPVLTATAAHCRELGSLVMTIERVAPILEPVYEFVAQEWHFDSLPENWDSDIRESSFAVMDVDTTQVTPVPLVALVLRASGSATGPHPLAALVPAAQTIPFEWKARPGLLMPWLGEKMTLSLSSDKSDWLMTSQEPMMPTLLGNFAEAPAVQADAVVQLDWRSATNIARTLLAKAADLELIPRRNAKDVETEFGDYYLMAAQLGRLRIEASAGPERIDFKGFFARLTTPEQNSAR